MELGSGSVQNKMTLQNVAVMSPVDNEQENKSIQNLSRFGRTTRIFKN